MTGEFLPDLCIPGVSVSVAYSRGLLALLILPLQLSFALDGSAILIVSGRFLYRGAVDAVLRSIHIQALDS